MKALFLFSKTTTIAQPWADAGIDCLCVDIQHPKGETKHSERITLVGADIRHYLPPKDQYIFACAFPPCTHLAVSGARWFKGKGLRALAESIELFACAAEIMEWTQAPYFIENPVSTIASYWRKPDFGFDPCDYGDPYTKKTCLWTGGGFIMPVKSPVEATLGSKMHLLPPSDDRADLRSETPAGFSRAVFIANNGIRLNQTS